MASREDDFHHPEDLAAQFVRRVPAHNNRSRYVTEAITAKLRQREQSMIQACEVANQSPDILAIEQDWDTLDEAEWIEKPGNNAPAR